MPPPMDDADSPPLPTPSFVDPGTADVLSALATFSFGATPALSSSSGTASPALAKPVYPTSSFPAYCLPRKGSAPGWDYADLDDDVNPSPVYGRLDADGFTVQTPGTPIAERPRFEYPDPNAPPSPDAAAGEGGASVAKRPSPTPTPAAAGGRRGSVSLPNVLTSSAASLLDDALGVPPPPSLSASSSSFLPPLQPLHPATSPFATPGSRRPSLALALHPSSTSSASTAATVPAALTRRRSNSHHRPSFSLDRTQLPPRASMSHVHPPAAPAAGPFASALRTDAPIPPSLRNHPAFAHAHSATAASGNAALADGAGGGAAQPASLFARRGSLPATHGPRRQGSLSLSSSAAARKTPSPPTALVGRLPTRRASLNDPPRARRAPALADEGGVLAQGRPKLGSIPSSGSDGSGSSSSGRTERAGSDAAPSAPAPVMVEAGGQQEQATAA